MAVRAGLVRYVEHVLATRTTYENIEEMPLLHHAVAPFHQGFYLYRPPDMIDLLIRFGADPNQKFEGLSAFALAISIYWRGRSPTTRGLYGQVVEHLLKKGSNPNVTVKHQRVTILPEGCFGNLKPEFRDIPITSLQSAVMESNRTVVKLLLDHGADIEGLRIHNWIYMARYDKPTYRLVKQYQDRSKAQDGSINAASSLDSRKTDFLPVKFEGKTYGFEVDEEIFESLFSLKDWDFYKEGQVIFLDDITF